MKDVDKIKVLGLAVLLYLLSVLSFMVLGGVMGYERGRWESVLMTRTDTVYVRDTVFVRTIETDTVIKKVMVPFQVTTHDTLVDSVWVELPMEWHHASVPDTADVWYHGVNAGIDSMRFHCRGMVVTNSVVRTEFRAPRLSAGVGVGAGWDGKSVVPVIGGELRWSADKTTVTAFGCVGHTGGWCAGVGVMRRIDIIK